MEPTQPISDDEIRSQLAAALTSEISPKDFGLDPLDVRYAVDALLLVVRRAQAAALREVADGLEPPDPNRLRARADDLDPQ